MLSITFYTQGVSSPLSNHEIILLHLILCTFPKRQNDMFMREQFLGLGEKLYQRQDYKE